MSEQNVEIVRRVYDCLARRDWDAMWRDFNPDFVLDTQVQGSYRARPKESSAEIEALIGHLFALRDGLIVRLQTFPQREKALEAAGLSE